jgi:cell division protein FtsZ
MQEIDEGNNVIFEAAGEEANVIFGVVKKDEMNDYISYTVIATGFDSARSNNYGSKTSTVKKHTPNLTDSLRGAGFNLFGSENVDSNNLDVPTILRVNSPKASIEDDEEKNTPSGFAVENSRYSWAKERNEKKDDSNDDDSSSFLRMIMD